MGQRHYRLAGTIAAALLLLLVYTGEAAAQVALVIGLAGTTAPPLAPMSEIWANTTISLGAGSRLTLMHYSNCTTETITGGIVTVLATGIGDRGATVESRTTVACPRVESLPLTERGADPSVLVMRGDPANEGQNAGVSGIAIPARSEIYFSGRQSLNIVSIAIVDAAGRVVASETGTSRLLRVNLAPNQSYRLRLSLRGRAPWERAISVAPAAATTTSLVLRVE